MNILEILIENNKAKIEEDKETKIYKLICEDVLKSFYYNLSFFFK